MQALIQSETDWPGSTGARSESLSLKRSSRKQRKEEKGGRGENGPTDSCPAAAPLFGHDFQYTESSVGVHTKLVAGFESTPNYSMEKLLMFPSVLSQTGINCPCMKTALGDGLYTTKNACSMVAACGARPYSFPHVNSIYMSHSVLHGRR